MSGYKTRDAVINSLAVVLPSLFLSCLLLPRLQKLVLHNSFEHKVPLKLSIRHHDSPFQVGPIPRPSHFKLVPSGPMNQCNFKSVQLTSELLSQLQNVVGATQSGPTQEIDLLPQVSAWGTQQVSWLMNCPLFVLHHPHTSPPSTFPPSHITTLTHHLTLYTSHITTSHITTSHIITLTHYHSHTSPSHFTPHTLPPHTSPSHFTPHTLPPHISPSHTSPPHTLSPSHITTLTHHPHTSSPSHISTLTLHRISSPCT